MVEVGIRLRIELAQALQRTPRVPARRGLQRDDAHREPSQHLLADDGKTFGTRRRQQRLARRIEQHLAPQHRCTGGIGFDRVAAPAQQLADALRA